MYYYRTEPGNQGLGYHRIKLSQRTAAERQPCCSRLAVHYRARIPNSIITIILDKFHSCPSLAIVKAALYHKVNIPFI